MHYSSRFMKWYYVTVEDNGEGDKELREEEKENLESKQERKIEVPSNLYIFAANLYEPLPYRIPILHEIESRVVDDCRKEVP